MAWTVHHPADCKLKDAAEKPGDAASPPANATAAADTFSAESIVNLSGKTWACRRLGLLTGWTSMDVYTTYIVRNHG